MPPYEAVFFILSPQNAFKRVCYILPQKVREKQMRIFTELLKERRLDLGGQVRRINKVGKKLEVLCRHA